ncbi:MAG TPA: magnesium/cobalt transporter CorA [Planctomycetota bacterium]|nr:magnesium/cobalt transporter CorA [Planctomycetota bacterium]
MKGRTRRKRRAARPPPGSTPGTLMVPPNAPKPIVRVMDYSADRVYEKTLASPREVSKYLVDTTDSITWVDVQGLGERHVLEALGDVFRLHRLALADVVNVPQRPKVDTYDNHLFILTRMTMLTPAGEVHVEQVSLFLGKSFVLTFQETYGDCFDPVRERIRKGIGIVRKSGADYLAYAILDAITDQYFPVVEAIGERIESLEDEVVHRPTPATLKSVYNIKRELLSIRRCIWPQRDAINALMRDESGHIGAEVRVYLRDCYDHTVQLIDFVETLRELGGGLLEVYLSSVANRTNEVMKVLTVVTSIFIPLTFIVGIYGMNFSFMPELRSPYGYPAIWAVLLAVAGSLLVFFWRKGWLRRADRPREKDEDEEPGR